MWCMLNPPEPSALTRTIDGGYDCAQYVDTNSQHIVRLKAVKRIARSSIVFPRNIRQWPRCWIAVSPASRVPNYQVYSYMLWGILLRTKKPLCVKPSGKTYALQTNSRLTFKITGRAMWISDGCILPGQWLRPCW